MTLEKYPNEVFPVLESWNNHKNPWYRRQSIVCLYYYSSLRKKRVIPFETAKKMVLNLINDEDVYVQKGVGWTLREMYNVYPEKTLKLIEDIVSDIHPAAWQASTEKLSKSIKERLKVRRKTSRKKDS